MIDRRRDAGGRWLTPTLVVATLALTAGCGSGSGGDNAALAETVAPTVSGSVQEHPTTTPADDGADDDSAGPAHTAASQHPAESPEREFGTSPTPMNGAHIWNVVDQYFNNYLCLTNAPEVETQLECLKFIYGSEAQGELVRNDRTMIDEAVEYRRNEPSYRQVLDYKIVDSRESDTELIAVVNVDAMHSTVNGTWDDGAGPIYRRLVFRKGTIITEQPLVEDDVAETWLLKESWLVEPGETAIE